jgi:hypothetical protein
MKLRCPECCEHLSDGVLRSLSPHVNGKFGFTSCRRATSAIEAPAAELSAARARPDGKPKMPLLRFAEADVAPVTGKASIKLGVAEGPAVSRTNRSAKNTRRGHAGRVDNATLKRQSRKRS